MYLCQYCGEVFDEPMVEDCREAGIETMTPQQLAALKSQWGEAQPIG